MNLIYNWSPPVDEDVAVFFAHGISCIFRQQYFRPQFSAITLLYTSLLSSPVRKNSVTPLHAKF
jgi:hypothetical protein